MSQEFVNVYVSGSSKVTVPWRSGDRVQDILNASGKTYKGFEIFVNGIPCTCLTNTVARPDDNILISAPVKGQ